ncbi:MAG: phosphomannomutase/phosphoglucomutase [Betaproteobacteria bacterium]|nr:phosphomannomutase/phosphoglucomutase [Betaproteobacteria bacterium]
MNNLDPSIFKAYDIRGVVGRNLDPQVVGAIGLALGARIRAAGGTEAVIGRDGRLSGPSLSAALAEGLRDAGVHVIDVGMVTTPVVYYGTFELGAGSGVAVTGSHNPPDYNGLKMVVAGDAIHGAAITSLGQEIAAGRHAPVPAAQRGTLRQASLLERYVARIAGDVKLARPMKIAIDCGNGVAGAVAPALFRALGCEVVELFCEVDGTFPNHHPDPAHPENLQDLIRCLRETDCEIGLAFDGDGDRLGVVTRRGDIIFPDRQLMLLAQEVLERKPGATIIYDVKCTRNLATFIRAHGGEPMMWRTGHSLVKARLKETGAPLAGEMSGHIFYKDRWYGFDDGLYAGARMLEILSRHADPGAVLQALPDSPATPELQLRCAEGEHFTLVEALKRNARFAGATGVIDIDGIRVEYPDGFGLARPSNTTPVVVMRFEADDAAALARIQGQFRAAILAQRPDADLPF